MPIAAAPIAVIDGVPISLPQALAAALAALGLMLLLTLLALWRASAARRASATSPTSGRRRSRRDSPALADANAELSGRLAGMGEWLGRRDREPDARGPARTSAS